MNSISSSSSIHLKNCCRARKSAETVAGFTWASRAVTKLSMSRRVTSAGALVVRWSAKCVDGAGVDALGRFGEVAVPHPGSEIAFKRLPSVVQGPKLTVSTGGVLTSAR